MKYKHIKLDQFYQGLPTGDIDDSTLDAGQRSLLQTAVEAGVYAPEAPEPAVPASLKKFKKESSDEPGAAS